MLNLEEVKWNLITSDIKLVSYSSTIYNDALSNIHKIYERDSSTVARI